VISNIRAAIHNSTIFYGKFMHLWPYQTCSRKWIFGTLRHL